MITLKNFLTSSEGSQLTFYVIDKIHYGDSDSADNGTSNLKSEEIVIDACPLHDEQPLKNPNRKLTSNQPKTTNRMGFTPKIFKYQPIYAIKTHFGKKVA